VPLSDIQSEILSLLAAHRNPESCVAGATALNRDDPRFSRDIDIFHDREESVAAAADTDPTVLADNGFDVQWVRREPGLRVAVAQRGGARTPAIEGTTMRISP
jgi:hypothetical protein